MKTFNAQVLVGSLLLGLTTVGHPQDRTGLPKMLSAADVAYQDYSRKLESYKASDTQLARYLGDIENYQIRISRNDGSYTVMFLPVSPPGETIAGGGAEYRVSPDLKILSLLRYK